MSPRCKTDDQDPCRAVTPAGYRATPILELAMRAFLLARDVRAVAPQLGTPAAVDDAALELA